MYRNEGEQMKKFFNDFKAFAMRGNVVDMAVGVVIGSAFTAIVTSLVKDIFTPLISAITGVANFEHLVFKIGEASINYGLFFNAIISFLIVSFSVFCMVRILQKISKQKEEIPTPPKKSQEEILLTEIRDLLKEKA